MSFLMHYQLSNFLKKKECWLERFVDLNDKKKAEFKDQPIDIKDIENVLNFEISKSIFPTQSEFHESLSEFRKYFRKY